MVQYGMKFPGTGAIRIPVPVRAPALLGTIAPMEAPLSLNGTEMMTPLLVPIHSRFEDIKRQVMRTKEKPNLPVPLKNRDY